MSGQCLSALVDKNNHPTLTDNAHHQIHAGGIDFVQGRGTTDQRY